MFQYNWESLCVLARSIPCRSRGMAWSSCIVRCCPWVHCHAVPRQVFGHAQAVAASTARCAIAMPSGCQRRLLLQLLLLPIVQIVAAAVAVLRHPLNFHDHSIPLVNPLGAIIIPSRISPVVDSYGPIITTFHMHPISRELAAVTWIQYQLITVVSL